jgi:predicted RNA-binding protein
MCDMTAYLVGKNGQEKIMESVERVERDDGRIRLSNIFGEEKTIEAMFEAIRDNKLYFSPGTH